MSLKAVVWALENEDVFSSAQKFVLIALANYANDEGRSYPAVATVCKVTKQSDDTVRRCLDQLKEAGIIADTGKKFGPTQQVKVWQLPDEAWRTKDPRYTGLQVKTKQEVKFEDPGKTPARPRQDPHLAGQTLEPFNKEPKTAAAFEESETKQPQKQRSKKRELTDLWCAEFKKKHGWAYKFQHAKDGQAADRLLALGMDAVDLITIAKSAWNRPAGFNCKHAATLAGFDCKYNDIRNELTHPPEAKPTYQKQRVDIRQFKSGNF